MRLCVHSCRTLTRRQKPSLPSRRPGIQLQRSLMQIDQRQLRKLYRSIRMGSTGLNERSLSVA